MNRNKDSRETIKMEEKPRFLNSRQQGLIGDAYNKIKQMLYNQEIIPGQKIIYEDLSLSFNMSTTPIITALSKLEQEGLVVLKFNKGYFVSQISSQEANDLLDVRQSLEEYSIQKLIDNLSEDKIMLLEDILAKMIAYKPSGVTRKRQYLDSLFHVGIAEMAGNTVVKQMLEQIFEKIYLRYRTERIPKERMEEANNEHRMLLEAIRKKNKMNALKTIRYHYKNVRYFLLNTIRVEEDYK